MSRAEEILDLLERPTFPAYAEIQALAENYLRQEKYTTHIPRFLARAGRVTGRNGVRHQPASLEDFARCYCDLVFRYAMRELVIEIICRLGILDYYRCREFEAFRMVDLPSNPDSDSDAGIQSEHDIILHAILSSEVFPDPQRLPIRRRRVKIDKGKKHEDFLMYMMIRGGIQSRDALRLLLDVKQSLSRDVPNNGLSALSVSSLTTASTSKLEGKVSHHESLTSASVAEIAHRRPCYLSGLPRLS